MCMCVYLDGSISRGGGDCFCLEIETWSVCLGLFVKEVYREYSVGESGGVDSR